MSKLAAFLRSKDACLIQSSGQESPGATKKDELKFNDAAIVIGRDSAEAVIHRIKEESENNTESLFNGLDVMLEGLLIKAYEDTGNTVLNNTKYLVAYLEMRKLQVEVLKSIAGHIGTIPVILRQSLPMADFMEHIAASFHELNNVVGLLAELEELNQHYKKEALPVTREEFEYRAILYQVLKELEYFLLLKRNFVRELENKNMKSYWS